MSLESKIDELIAALDRNTASNGAAVSTETGAPQTEAEHAKRGRKPKNTTESTQPAANAAAAASTTAPVSAQTGAASAVSANSASLLAATTSAVVDLANKYSRDEAIAILGKKRGPNGERNGVSRCSDLNALDLQDVLNEATAALETAKAAAAAKANASLV